MPRYYVPLTTWANATVVVEADTRNASLEVGDEWSAVITDGKPEVYAGQGRPVIPALLAAVLALAAGYVLGRIHPWHRHDDRGGQ